MFRIYVLWRTAQKHVAAAESFHVVWQKAGLRVLYLHYDRETGTATAQQSSKVQSFDQVLLRSPAGHAVYYIVDGMPPEFADSLPREVHVLEVSSPKPVRWKEFEKEEAADLVTRFMPLLSLAELLSMRQISNYSADQIRERYRVLGGSTRNVLRSLKTASAIINDAFMTSAGLDGIISSNDSVLQASVDVSSTLIHLNVNEEEDAALLEDASAVSADSEPVAPYSRCEPVFASRYVRHQVTLRREKQFVAVLRELVSSSTSIMYTSVMQGRMYEDYVNSRIVDTASNLCKKRDLAAAASAS
ncbi:MAG: hypothetical protein Q7T57_02460, partial [Dehalococcoidales bacterium]|nr:hypothetical protein [Dehalococcoidales bacterium]